MTGAQIKQTDFFLCKFLKLMILKLMNFIVSKFLLIKKKELKRKLKQEQQQLKSFLQEMLEHRNLCKVARTLIFKLINS